MTASPLRRTRPAPPVRHVHLGLGAFSRSHTAWYTQASEDGGDWGIAAYTGRSRDLADRLTAQDGLYTLVGRGPSGDTAEVVTSIVRAHAGDDLGSLLQDLAAPATALVSLTITEVGYRFDTSGGPDRSDPLVQRDGDELRAVASGRLDLAEARPATALGRLLLGLEGRRRAGAGPLALLSCDNLPDNGGRLGRGLTAWADEVAPELRQWIDAHVAFVSSSIDRITPRISSEEEAILRDRYGDRAPVVAEPFRDWVLSGDFPAGRPEWESAGARIVDDLEPWESRKLWLLNGSHTLLACLGLLRGHATVAEAVADPVCRGAVEALWDDAERVLPDGLAVPEYRASLLERFENARIEHRLEQIAQDTALKIRLRIVPVAEAALRAGSRAPGALAALGAWVAATRAGVLPGATDGADLLRTASPALAEDADASRRVDACAAELLA